jgi:enoyl-CoA hydratase/carnithine racemase
MSGDPDCRAIVLAAAGKCFCAGADFGGATPVDAEAVYRAALPIFRRRRPLIAAIQGPAVGGGLGLALAADFRIAAPQARFHANFVRIGLHPGFGLTYTLPRLIGVGAASSMLLLGSRIDGAEAVRIGLADQMAEPTDLRGDAISFAKRIGAGAPLAVSSILAALNSNLADEIEQAMQRELAEQRKLFDSEDFREGVLASAQRREPVFRGC